MLKPRSAKLCFVGTSHAAEHLAAAAWEKGFALVEAEKADVVFVSEDTPIAPDGVRDEAPIRALVEAHLGCATVVVTSQVAPGFTASFKAPHLFHQVELLRLRDAGERARHPELWIVGCDGPHPHRAWPPALPEAYLDYLLAWGCPIHRVGYHEAEFAKIAVNMHLAAQVDYANRMHAACARIGARWDVIAEAIKTDRRIGPHAYLEPGRWQDSIHLLRDAWTLKDIEDE